MPLSVNIEEAETAGEYIVTPNVRRVYEDIAQSYRSGNHSFCIIGTYGTGKSCFLANLMSDIEAGADGCTFKRGGWDVWNYKKAETIGITCDYRPLKDILAEKLPFAGDDILAGLRTHVSQKDAKPLVLFLDEFGKVLEHAAKCDPEKELYFIQQLAEFCNATKRDILLVAAIHQGMTSYANRLSAAQKNEWEKVKGRFYEVAFAEPVEQVLFLAARRICGNPQGKRLAAMERILHLAQKSHFISENFAADTALQLYPLDPFAAVALAQSFQRYGQNERSLFSFLGNDGRNSISKFDSAAGTYNLGCVYNYACDSFYSYLTSTTGDAMGWRAIQSAIERVEVTDLKDIALAVDVVKAVGLLNIFGGPTFSMSESDFVDYIELSTGRANVATVIEDLKSRKIIRFADYRKRLVIFEGTDINIDEEIEKAYANVSAPDDLPKALSPIFFGKISAVKAYYYHRGTPRFFEYRLQQKPSDMIPSGDTDGFIQLLFSPDDDTESVREFSRDCQHAILFGSFRNTSDISASLRRIGVFDYILDKVLVDKTDKIAVRELEAMRAYEMSSLSKSIDVDSLTSANDVTWFFKGEEVTIRTLGDFNRVLSKICDEFYSRTPRINNELFNKHKLSGTIQAAKVKYLSALVNHYSEADLGFEQDKFPPEKTIYYSLLKETGLHTDGDFSEPLDGSDIWTMWQQSEEFLRGSIGKPRKVSELIKILSEQPYKVKQGVLEFWIPTFLFIKRSEYSLFNGTGVFIPDFNEEVCDLMKKHPGEFSVKALNTSESHVNVLNEYRRFLQSHATDGVESASLIDVVGPFFHFYNRLNSYAKTTRRLDNIETLKFRDVLSKAKDPEKAFFEDIPEALGYDVSALDGGGVGGYCESVRKAVDDLRNCYVRLVDRIEAALIDGLGLKSHVFSEYAEEIRSRISGIRETELSDKQRAFMRHASIQTTNRIQWYESVCYGVLSQPLERLRDEQEANLIDGLVFKFKELEQQATLSRAMTYALPDQMKEKAAALENKIDALLTGDQSVDIHTLMTILKKKLG